MVKAREKRCYHVTVIRTLHYNTGEVIQTTKDLGYTYAVSEAKAITNMKHRTRQRIVTESLYGPAISEKYQAMQA